MKRTTYAPLPLLVSLAVACGSPPAPESANDAAAESAAEAPAQDPEAAKHAEELAKLDKERAQLRADMEKEKARWTPEMKKAASNVAGVAFPTGPTALEAAVEGKYRKPENKARDQYRNPIKTLAFFGFSPTMTILEYGPGAGWYTEILAPAVAMQGKLLVTSSDPNGPKWERSTFYGERTKMMLETSPELYGKVELAVFDPKAPALDLQGNVDMALIIRGMHGMHNRGQVDAWLKEIHEALRPGGVLGIVQHRAAEGANPDESSKQGYLPQAWVVQKVESAGFELADSSEINANPKDTKDHPKGVWSLPPSLDGDDKDKEKYLAIGESDRMTLKFVKK